MSLFPKKLGGIVAKTASTAFAKRGFMESRILTEWERIVGPRIACGCLPEKIVFPRGETRNGTLHLMARPAAALELQHLEPVIREKIAVYFGYQAISRIVITQSLTATAAPPAPKAKPSAPNPQAESDARRLAADITDAELHDALVSLGDAVFSRSRSY